MGCVQKPWARKTDGKASLALLSTLRNGASQLGLEILPGSGVLRSERYGVGFLLSFFLQAGCGHLLGDLKQTRVEEGGNAIPRPEGSKKASLGGPPISGRVSHLWIRNFLVSRAWTTVAWPRSTARGHQGET